MFAGVRGEGEFQLAPPRRVTRSHRGGDMLEYQVRVVPPPSRAVRDVYNATKPPGIDHPRLKPNGFIVFCRSFDELHRRLALVERSALARLVEIEANLRLEPVGTIDLRDPVPVEADPMCPECTDTPEFLPPNHPSDREPRTCPKCQTSFVARGEAVHRLDA